MSKNFQPLYESLGCLFYSIAASDEKVTKAEINKVLEAVKNKWIPLEDSTDQFGTDAANYISIAFDFMMEDIASAAEAWSRFSDSYKVNKDLFTPKIKALAIETAEEIANSFSGMNKTELKEIEQLKQLFAL